MFKFSDYAGRGYNFLHNRFFPAKKRLSSLMIYATDLCDSGCKHCLIWAKRPVTYLPLDKIKSIMASHCISSNTSVGLEGGEFLLHPEADKIMEWFSRNHRNYDLFSNCLRPDKLIEAVKKYKPKRLYISLDGDRDTYHYMRGKDGYDSVIKVITALKDTVPVFVMFTLSPYNDFGDLEHVAAVCEQYNVFLRVGIYNNIPFFDTIDDSKAVVFGQLKDQTVLTYKEAVALREERATIANIPETTVTEPENLPGNIEQFSENIDYIKLYANWRSGKLRLKCNSILDSLIILPNGDVPICQNLDLKLGNIYRQSLDDIFNGSESVKTQQHYSANCNQCWISYHRKYDIILYRTFEKFFGRWATIKMMGYYKWGDPEDISYEKALE